MAGAASGGAGPSKVGGEADGDAKAPKAGTGAMLPLAVSDSRSVCTSALNEAISSSASDEKPKPVGSPLARAEANERISHHVTAAHARAP